MASIRRDVDMTTGNITRHILTFAFPLLLGTLFQQFYNLVDTYVVGNFATNEAYAAVGSVTPIVNTFIGLFKDTTLVMIVGIFDFLRTIEASLTDPTWATPTTRATGSGFAAVFYVLCCWGMSRYSIAVERRLAAGQKR